MPNCVLHRDGERLAIRYMYMADRASHCQLQEANQRVYEAFVQILNMPAKSITKEIFIRKYIMYVLNRGFHRVYS